SKRPPWRSHQQVNPEETVDDSLSPLLGPAAEEAGKDRQQGKERLGKGSGRPTAFTARFSLFARLRHQATSAGVVWDSLLRSATNLFLDRNLMGRRILARVEAAPPSRTLRLI